MIRRIAKRWLRRLVGVGTVSNGPYLPDRDQPPLLPSEREIVDRFHDLYYRRWQIGSADTISLSWFGYRVLKCPLDLWVYQELLFRRQPDIIVETGTRFGGSAIYLAMILDLIGHGSVVTIDIDPLEGRPAHPRITYLTGSSTDPSIIRRVQGVVGGQRAMVILDLDHSEQHVFAELKAYAPLVQKDDYLIVEDTNVNGHPTCAEHGPGPMEAVEKFLAEIDGFVVDENCERFLMTLNPKGYLKRA